MACQQTPTATLFGSTVLSTNAVSTIVSTELQTLIIDAITVISTCIPTVVASATTCVPTQITSTIASTSVRTSVFTTFQTVPVVTTVTSPIQTLFASACPNPDYPDVVTVPKPKESDPSPVTPTPPTPTPSRYVEPVTLTRTSTSTDPSGNIVVATIATVSTPSPDSTQSASEGPNTAVIGSAVGGGCGLIALIGIIWFVMYKRRRSGRWDEDWAEDEGHQAGAAECKQEPPATADNGSSPNPYLYGVVGHETPSPLLRGDQHSGAHSHSRSTSIATGYADHGRPTSQTPLMFAALPPQSTLNSPPTLQQQSLPVQGAGLDGTLTPIWASPAAQQGYVQQGYPPMSSDPNFTPAVTSTYNAISTHGPPTGYVPSTDTAANPAVAYPSGAAAPVTGGKRSSMYNDHKQPLEQTTQHGVARQPSHHQQTGSSGSTAKLADAPIDNSDDALIAGMASGHAPSIKGQEFEKGGFSGAPTSDPSRRTSLMSVASGAPKAPAQPPIVEEAPPAYQQ